MTSVTVVTHKQGSGPTLKIPLPSSPWENKRFSRYQLKLKISAGTHRENSVNFLCGWIFKFEKLNLKVHGQPCIFAKCMYTASHKASAHRAAARRFGGQPTLASALRPEISRTLRNPLGEPTALCSPPGMKVS